MLLVDGKPWLLLRADARLLDTLAAFGAEAEDREPGMDDEEETDDDTTNDLHVDDADLEYDFPEMRRGFIVGRLISGGSRRPWRDRYTTKDQGELMAAERFCRTRR